MFACRGELEKLALDKQRSEETVTSLRARCFDLEEQCVQHGRMHQRMKDRWVKWTHNPTRAVSNISVTGSININLKHVQALFIGSKKYRIL